MSIPGLVLGIIISVLYGAIFHFWRGGGLFRLILYLILSISGFWIGQIIATKYHLTFISIGSLHLGFSTICSIIFLSIGHWLSLTQVERI
ncbi:MAG: hypothetical protein GYA34_09350 [Chloroflexi bacterium]|nr:hypothetical protein [Chloroflexota bacterium]